MNYGRIAQREKYRIFNAVKLPEKDEDLGKIEEKDLRLIDPTEVSTVDLLYKHFKNSQNIVILKYWSWINAQRARQNW